MLSKSWCPDCHYTYEIWNQYNVKEKIYIIELDKFEDQNEAEELEKAFTEIAGRKWVPTIFFHGKILGTEEDLKRWTKEVNCPRSLKILILLINFIFIYIIHIFINLHSLK